jgi:Tol biopolymer transport system component
VNGLFDPTVVGFALLFSTDLRGRRLRRLSEPGIDGVYEDNAARFSPDGRSAVVARIRSADLKIAVFRLDLDRRPAKQLTDWSLGADEPDYSPVRSGPTKDLLVFGTFQGPEPGPFGDIATLPAFCHPLTDCTSAARLLTDHAASGGRAFAPTWSADGRRVVFSESPPDQFPDLWTARPDGSDRRRLTNTPDVLELAPDAGLAVWR